MPAGGSTGEQALGASRLHGCAAVGTTQAMTVAVVPDRLIDDLLPTAQVSGFLLLEAQTLLGIRPASLPPAQPFRAEGMDEEVEQTGEADANDRVPFTALAVALHLKTMVEQTSNREGACTEGIGLSFLVAGVDLVEVHLGQIAVEIGAQDLAAGIQAVTAEAVLQLVGADGAMVVGQPTPRFLTTLVAVDLNEFRSQLRGGEQIGIGASDRFGSELDRAFAGVELLGHRCVHNVLAGTGVINAGVVGHPQRITLGVDPPVALLVLLPEVVLGGRSRLVVRSELAHAGAAADVSSHDRDGGFVDQTGSTRLR